ncbi:MAG: iron-containing alcohol dehydrogenase, partial [Betaproteobacteria bacterium]
MALITYLTKIQFDFGAIKLLPAEMGLLGMKRPLLVTDQGVLQSGLVERVIQAIGSREKPSIFSDTPANPTESACRVALEQFREQACDGLIALGGGSAMDL